MLPGMLPGFGDNNMLIVSAAVFPSKLMGLCKPGAPDAILVGDPNSGLMSGDINSRDNSHQLLNYWEWQDHRHMKRPMQQASCGLVHLIATVSVRVPICNTEFK
jgi:hypothetical protein